jgi:hypothetical protein
MRSVSAPRAGCDGTFCLIQTAYSYGRDLFKKAINEILKRDDFAILDDAFDEEENQGDKGNPRRVSDISPATAFEGSAEIQEEG